MRLSCAKALVIGVAWLVINLVIDLPLFSAGPMAMPLADYVKDIGLTYLIIPVVTVGLGYLLETKNAADKLRGQVASLHTRPYNRRP